MDNENFKTEYFQTPSFPQNFPSEGRKLGPIKIILVILIIAALGVAVSLYARIWDPLWNPFRPEPDEVIAKMIQKMKEMKSTRVFTNFVLNFKDTPSPFKLEGNILTESDSTNSKNLKSSTNFDLSLAFQGTKFILNLNTKTIGEILYVKFVTIPALPMISQMTQIFGVNLSDIKGTWIKIEKKSIENTFGNTSLQEKEELRKSKEKQEEMVSKLKKILENKKFYFVKKELPDEKINENKAYHYVVSLDNQEVKKAVLEFSDLIGKEEEMIINPEELEKNIDDFFKKVGELSGDIWISKKDNILYKFHGEKKINLSAFEPTEKGTIYISVNIDFSDFNQPMKIEAPKEFKLFEEVFGAVRKKMEKKMEETLSQSRDIMRITDLRQIEAAMELYYSRYNRYPQFNTMPTKIGNFMLTVPQDPGSGPCFSYNLIPNLNDSQKYCIWACLESGGYYIISHKGAGIYATPPKNLDCQEEERAIPYPPGWYEYNPNTPNTLFEKEPSLFQASLLGNILSALKLSDFY